MVPNADMKKKQKNRGETSTLSKNTKKEFHCNSHSRSILQSQLSCLQSIGQHQPLSLWNSFGTVKATLLRPDLQEPVRPRSPKLFQKTVRRTRSEEGNSVPVGLGSCRAPPILSQWLSSVSLELRGASLQPLPPRSTAAHVAKQHAVAALFAGEQHSRAARQGPP